MSVAGDKKRTTTTVPKEHIDFYEEEVRRQNFLGTRRTVADYVREAIARDVKRRQRKG